MPIHIRCADCANEFDVPDTFAGKQGKCPQCGKVMTAPKAASPAPAAPRRGGDSQVLSSSAPATSGSKSGLAAGKSATALPRAKALPDGGPSAAPSATEFPIFPASSQAGLVSTPGAGSSAAILAEKNRLAAQPGGLPGWVWGVVGGSAVAVVAAIGIVIWSVSSQPTVATPGPHKPGPHVVAPRPAVPNDPGKKRPPPSVAAAPMVTEWNKHKVAKNLEEATAAMVKIMFPTGGEGAILGSGFLIDERGWVATNYHVIEKANSAIRCYMNDGKDYAVAGLLAQDKERDLAIIKLADVPFQMTLLDINNFGEPGIGTEIYCYGHPHGVDFSLSQGVVGRVCATSKLDGGSQQFLYSTHNTPDDMIWIQVDAKINPGNSGGPLIDKKTLKVWGVNSWVNRQVGFGYASHVQYLRDLKQRTSDTPKEFPKPEKTPEFAGVAPLPDNFSAKMIEENLANCEKFNWLPTKADDTTALVEFARLMHGAREIARKPESAEKITEAQNREINTAATSAWQKLTSLEWSDERIAAINKVASKTLENSGFGVLAVCECVAPEGNGPVLKMIGTEKSLLAAADSPSIFTHGSRVLVIGLSSPVMMRVKTPAMKEAVNVRYVKSHFTRVIQEGSATP